MVTKCDSWRTITLPPIVSKIIARINRKNQTRDKEKAEEKSSTIPSKMLHILGIHDLFGTELAMTI
jgi:hypothetical protein